MLQLKMRRILRIIQRLFTSRALDESIKRNLKEIFPKGYDYRQFKVLQKDEILFSMVNFTPIIEWFMEKVIQPTGILEIGMEQGIFTSKLLELARKHKVPYYGIDPNIGESIKKEVPSGHLFEDISLRAIPRMLQAYPPYEFNIVFIDGDHNYYTVNRELDLLLQKFHKQSTPFVIFLHDVTWPNAFRDSYYNPETVPQKHRKRLLENGFINIESKEPDYTGKGLASGGGMFYASKEGGEKNGILPAVMDNLQKYSKEMELIFIIVPAVFGLGIITSLKRLNKRQREQLLYFTKSLKIFFPLLWTLEYNRLMVYGRYRKSIWELIQKDKSLK